MTKNKDFSVGIPVKNEYLSLENTLISINSNNLIPSEIIVCVNGSTDGTLELSKSLESKFSNLKTIESEPGKANAWNKINLESHNNTILFTDGDVTLRPKTSENLMSHLIQNKNLSLVGGNFYRVPPKLPTSHTTFSDMSYGIFTNNSHVSGGLYVIDREKIFSQMNNLEISKMPKDIINDDGFLSMVSSQFNTVEIIPNAYINVNPILTFDDWKKMRIRLEKGYKQLNDKYPNYRTPSTFDNRISNYISSFKNAQTNLKKFGSGFYSIQRELIHRRVNNQTCDSFAHLWEEITSTKK
jgi:glycosyltransferase involved in cell wall biosynthesis